MSEPTSVEGLSDNLKRYINTNYELLKLETTEKTSVIGSSTISILLVGLAGITFILFLSICAGYYFSTLVGETYLGFAIVAGFYFLLTILLLLGRKKLITTPLRDKIIRKLFQQAQQTSS